jgi:hypothetical protein
MPSAGYIYKRQDLMIGINTAVYKDGHILRMDTSILPSFIPDTLMLDKKGVQVFITEAFLWNAVTAVGEAGFVSVEKSGFFVSFRCSARLSVWIKGRIGGKGRGKCEIVVLGGWFKEWFKFYLNAEFAVAVVQNIRNAVLYFDIESVEFWNLVLEIPKLNVVWENIDWTLWFFNILLGGVKEGVNEFLGGNGIALPKFEGLDYSDLSEIVHDNYIQVFVSPVFS